MDLEAQIRRAEDSQFLLGHPLYVGAFGDLERELFEQLAAVNMHDDASKNELLRTIKNLRRLKGVLERHIVDGVAAKELLRRNTLDRAKEWLGI